MRLLGTQYWRRRARLQLKLEPLCRMCVAQGRIVPATCADHIEPHRDDPNKFILGALQSLCTACHSGRKQSIERLGYDRAVGVDGWPLDSNHPVYQWEDPEPEPAELTSDDRNSAGEGAGVAIDRRMNAIKGSTH